MNKFASLYSIEAKKTFKTKVLLVISIILVILLVIMAVAFEMINSLGFDIGVNTEITNAQQGLDYYTNLLTEFDKGIENGTVKNTFWNNPRGQLQSYVTYFQYLVDNDLTLKQAQPYNSSIVSLENTTSGVGFVRTIMGIVLEFAILAVIIISAGNYVSEFKNGTLKMLLLRPVSRRTVFTAKWCASMTLGSIIYVGATMLGMIYGLARFKGVQSDIVMVAGTSAFLVNSASVFAMEFFAGLLKMFIFCQLTYFISNLTKSRNITLVLSILLLFIGGLLSQLLGFMYIGFVDLIYNMNFLASFGVGVSVYPGTTVYGSLIILAVYIALFMAVNYISFDKREIN